MPVDQLIGEITPAGPAFESAAEGLGKVAIFGLQLFFIIAAIFVLVYLLWGAYDYIMSSGDKENVENARSKMTNAIWGIILMIIALTIFSLIAGDILGIIVKDANGNWIFKLPTLSCKQTGEYCSTASECCSNHCIAGGGIPPGPSICGL